MEIPAETPDEEDAPTGYRWRKLTIRRVKRIAQYVGRGQNFISEYLMAWALDDWDQTQQRKGSGWRSTDPLEPDEKDEKPKGRKAKK